MLHDGVGLGADRPFAEVRVDPEVAHEVAATYRATLGSPHDRRVIAAYAELQAQSDAFFEHITRPGCPSSVRVVFTRQQEPYATDRELIEAVRVEGTLEVPVTPRGAPRSHPMFGCERGGAYDRFRAVHDILGHVALGRGFDRDGEYETWRAQDAQYRGLARWALATELHGEHSVRWTTGQPAEHRAVLLDPGLIARARRGWRHVENPVAATTSG